MSKHPSPRAGDPLTSELQAQIGRRLKAHYDNVLSEPVPDRFAELLAQLEDIAAARRTGDDEA